MKLQLLVDFMSKFRRSHLFYADKQCNKECFLQSCGDLQLHSYAACKLAMKRVKTDVANLYAATFLVNFSFKKYPQSKSGIIEH